MGDKIMKKRRLACRGVGRASKVRSDAAYQQLIMSLVWTPQDGVSSYRNLTQNQHKQALAWLHRWYKELAAETAEANEAGGE